MKRLLLAGGAAALAISSPAEAQMSGMDHLMPGMSGTEEGEVEAGRRQNFL
jgi:hypothetical protein